MDTLIMHYIIQDGLAELLTCNNGSLYLAPGWHGCRWVCVEAAPHQPINSQADF